MKLLSNLPPISVSEYCATFRNLNATMLIDKVIPISGSMEFLDLGPSRCKASDKATELDIDIGTTHIRNSCKDQPEPYETPASLLICRGKNKFRDCLRSWIRGDRIAGFVYGGNQVQPQECAFTEYYVAKGDLWLKVPRTLTARVHVRHKLSDEEASTLRIGITTVGQVLYQSFNLLLPGDNAKADFPLLIYSASTATGTLAAYVYAVFDYNDPDYIKKIEEYTYYSLVYTLYYINTQFGLYLMQNSITAYNDVTLDDLDMLTRQEQEKILIGGDRKRMEALLMDRNRHEELVAALTARMQQPRWSSNSYTVLDEAGVDAVARQLYGLKHFGVTLKMVKNTISSAHKETYRERPYRVRSHEHHTSTGQPGAGGGGISVSTMNGTPSSSHTGSMINTGLSMMGLSSDPSASSSKWQRSSTPRPLGVVTADPTAAHQRAQVTAKPV
ncbi:hypothetical protein B0H63DRAFT_523320 [Podospora didyma]|uniref:Uncharacterized protein n=1 Tax=Podospora didyma TaxID=330526 RepID=A0AAE0NR71_9PEZI|nr:hypothetical protein B0H63DRAFT_523320 [Podospora didyma]